MTRWDGKVAGGKARRGRKAGAPVGEESRLRGILDAALHAFARQGFSRTPVAEVAAAAGVASGTVIYHFQTKENLLGVLAWECLHLLWRACSSAANAADPGPERLRAYVQAYFEFLRRDPDRLLLLFKTEPLALSLDDVAPGLDIRTLWQALRMLLVDIFREAGPADPEPGHTPERLASVLLAHLSGSAWLHLFFAESLDELRGAALDLADSLVRVPARS
jgi:TetR/AcrR family fatty acid metabolism transcriptional regulator